MLGFVEAKDGKIRRFELIVKGMPTGQPSAHGEYSLADATYAELLDRLTARDPTAVPDALRENINAFYAAAPGRFSDKKERKRADKVRKNLALLNTQDTKDTKKESFKRGINCSQFHKRAGCERF